VAGGGKSKSSISKNKPTKQLTLFKKYFVSIGWKSNFIQKCFSESDGKFLKNESFDYWIQSFAISWFNENNTDFLSVLRNLHFKPKVLQTLINLISPLLNTSYSDSQLFDIVLDNVLQRNKPVSSASFLLDLQENTWKTTKEYGESVLYNFKIPLKTLVKQKINNNHLYLYHATSWNYALDIVNNGIDHLKGRRCLDFGIIPGFYLSDDIKNAFDWCQKNKLNWKNEMCVIIFKVSTLYKKLKTKTFEIADNEWEYLTKNSRLCQTNRNLLDTYDMVHGPMVANVSEVVKNKAKPTTHTIQKFQFASKSDRSDSVFNKARFGIIWLQKQ
jgi:hypothetical protein